MERGLSYVWGSLGDAEYNYLSYFCLEELVGELFFNCLEYGTGVSYVVSIEGTQCPNF